MNSRTLVGLLVGLYLLAIVAANLLATHFVKIGHPEWTAATALAFIAFDLVSRDRLHDLWGSRRWIGMALLIVTGSIISYLLNADAARVAIASTAAFATSLLADAVVYELAQRRGAAWLVRSNASNLVGAAFDSAVFVLIISAPAIVAFNQWTAKVAGGLVFAWLLRPRKQPVLGIALDGRRIGTVTEIGEGGIVNIDLEGRTLSVRRWPG